jgi:hypothetical protein
VIAAYLVNIGETVKLSYTIEEDLHTFKFQLTLNSGDAFAINSQVQGLTFTVKEICKDTKPKELVLREGSLLMTVENV